jgi:hypothetical protein
MRLQQPSTRVIATPASALVFGGDTELPVSAYDVHDEAGEQVLHLPSLAVPRDKRFRYDLNGANCMARWARIPMNYKGAVDVVIHFHGFSGQNAMKLPTRWPAAASSCACPASVGLRWAWCRMACPSSGSTAKPKSGGAMASDSRRSQRGPSSTPSSTRR